MGIDPISQAVDDNLMVKPTQEGEVGRVVVSALTAGLTVMDLEPVAGPTTVGSTALIPVGDKAFELGGQVAGGFSYAEGDAVSCLEDQLYFASTQEGIQGLGTDSGPTGNGHPCLSQLGALGNHR